MKVITVGRSEENDRVITDPCTSRHHLQIIQHDDGHFSLSDFGSTNGTYVNGQKISGEIPLSDTDVVRIGNTTIPWRMYFEETSASTPNFEQHADWTSPSSPSNDLDGSDKKTSAKGIINTMSIGGKIFTALLLVYIIFAITMLIVNPSSDSFILSFRIGGIIGACMVVFGIILKAKTNCQPANVLQPNGEKPGFLMTFLGIGQNILGAFKFRKIDDTQVSYTFLMVIIPLIPTGCYRVKKISEGINSVEWRIYGSEKSRLSEIASIYLIFYGLLFLLISIFPTLGI